MCQFMSVMNKTKYNQENVFLVLTNFCYLKISVLQPYEMYHFQLSQFVI
jgi:hypothetical protein